MLEDNLLKLITYSNTLMHPMWPQKLLKNSNGLRQGDFSILAPQMSLFIPIKLPFYHAINNESYYNTKFHKSLIHEIIEET